MHAEPAKGKEVFRGMADIQSLAEDDRSVDIARILTNLRERNSGIRPGPKRRVRGAICGTSGWSEGRDRCTARKWVHL
jgi:hypothetical protein